MELYEEDKIKYKKKKPSSVSDAKKKSKHKHDYETVLIKHTFNLGFESVCYMFGKRCKICGIIKRGSTDNEKYKNTEKLDSGGYRLLIGEEILERYPELEVISEDV